MMFDKLCLIGVGLIGGSIALAAREQGVCRHIVALGQTCHRQNLIEAKQLGVIDAYYCDTQRAVQDADCVIIGTPVGAVEEILAELHHYWSDRTIYTDVGSTKGSVIAAAKKVFGYVPANFVPAHPIAGREKSGVTAAVADLYRNKRVILTPVRETSSNALDSIRQFWEKLGASVSLMEVSHHDAVLAATSHLPHVLAFALVDLLGRKDEQEEIFKYAAGGFKDFTRIASSDPKMWRDICLANRDEIVPLIHQLQDELRTIADLLENNRNQQLFDKFSYAKKARQRFLDLFE